MITEFAMEIFPPHKTTHTNFYFENVDVEKYIIGSLKFYFFNSKFICYIDYDEDKYID